MTILETARFNALAEAIARQEPCHLQHAITLDQIKTLLVEFGFVPACVADDEESA